MRWWITIPILVITALLINMKISEKVIATRKWDETLAKMTTPTYGYFGNKCTKLYVDEGDIIYHSVIYDLRRLLYNGLKKAR